MTSEKLREHLECSICLDIFTSPKILPCQHTFCENCLLGAIMDDISTSSTCGSHKQSFSCPICRQETLPPQSDLSPDQWAGLFPTNLLAAALIESMPNLKTAEEKKQQPRLLSPHTAPRSSAFNDPETLENASGVCNIPPLDTELIRSLLVSVELGCEELKRRDEETLEKVMVLKSIGDLTPEEQCQLESLRHGISTRLNEVVCLEGALHMSALNMNSDIPSSETSVCDSDLQAMYIQLSEYEEKLHKLFKMALETNLCEVLNMIKTSPVQSTGEAKIIAQPYEELHGTYIQLWNRPSQSISGTFIPSCVPTAQSHLESFNSMHYPSAPALFFAHDAQAWHHE